MRIVDRLLLGMRNSIANDPIIKAQRRWYRGLKRMTARTTRRALAAGILAEASSVSMETRKAAARALTEQSIASITSGTGRIAWWSTAALTTIILILPGSLVVPELMQLMSFNEPPTLLHRTLVLAPAIVTVFAIEATEFAPIPGRRRAAGFIALMFGVAISCLVAYINSSLDMAASILVEVLLVFPIAFLAVWCSRSMVYVFFTRQFNNWERSNPETVAIASLSIALNEVLESWNYSTRRYAASRVRHAATSVGVDYPCQFGLDTVHDAESLARLGALETRIRSLCGPLAIPTLEAQATFARDADELIAAISLGDIGSIPTNASHIQEISGAGSSIQHRAARVAISILPFAAALTFVQVGPDLAGATGYLMILALLWAAIGLVSTWNPNWISELAEARSIANEIRGRGTPDGASSESS